jgi:hypothetical protein
LLIREYGLRKLSKRKSVINLNNFYLILYTLWIHDESIFTDKRQRVQIDAELFIITFFNYKSYIIFDIRIKLNNPKNKNLDKSVKLITILIIK